MTQQPATLKTDSLQQHLDQLVAFLNNALQQRQPLHPIKRGLWTQLLHAGSFSVDAAALAG